MSIVVVVGPFCWPNANVAGGFGWVGRTFKFGWFGAVVVVVVAPNWRKRWKAPELNWLSAWWTSNGCKAGTLIGGGGRAGSTRKDKKSKENWKTLNIYFKMKCFY